MVRDVAEKLRTMILTVYRMVKVSDTYSLEDLCQMEEEDMSALLRFYTSGKVPRLACIKAMRGEFEGFDGSFGFCGGGG